MENKHDATHVRSEAAFVALVFAVYACAAHLVDDKRLTLGRSMDEGGMGMVYYERYVSMRSRSAANRQINVSFRALILQYISHAHTQVAHVQCFLLMSSFLCSVNCLPQAWILVGQAVRIGQDLGLHVSRLLSFRWGDYSSSTAFPSSACYHTDREGDTPADLVGSIHARPHARSGAGKTTGRE